jgi:hypothetical protein
MQVLAAGPIEEPRSLTAALADGVLQRPEDPQGISFGAIEEIVERRLHGSKS